MAASNCYCLLLVVCVSCAGTELTSAQHCGQDDLPHTSLVKLYADHCYQFVSEELYWPEARTYCHKHGGSLVRIENSDVYTFLKTTLNDLWWQNDGVWIGLHDRNTELEWHWDTVDNNTGAIPVTWSNWGPGHPSSSFHMLRDCVRMARDAGHWRWYETPCDSMAWTYRFICQYRALEDSNTVTSRGVNSELNDVANEQSRPVQGEGHGSSSYVPFTGLTTVLLSCTLATIVILFVIFLLWKRRQVKSSQLFIQRHLSNVLTLDPTNPITNQCLTPNHVYCSSTCSDACPCRTQHVRLSNVYVHPVRRPITEETSAVYCPMNAIVRLSAESTTTTAVDIAMTSSMHPSDTYFRPTPSAYYEPMNAYRKDDDVTGTRRHSAGSDVDQLATGSANCESSLVTPIDNIYEPLDGVSECGV